MQSAILARRILSKENHVATAPIQLSKSSLKTNAHQGTDDRSITGGSDSDATPVHPDIGMNQHISICIYIYVTKILGTDGSTLYRLERDCNMQASLRNWSLLAFLISELEPNFGSWLLSW